MLPLNNELPSSMNDLKDASSCPTCGTSRWKLDRTKTKKRKGVPTKVMWYFPPIPIFRRLFRSPKVAKDLMWHAQEREFDGKLHHPSDSPSWKLVDHRWLDFASKPRNLRLAILADGKTKDGLKSHLDLLEMGLRCELGPSKVVNVPTLDKLQNDVVVTLCLLEKYFPSSFFDIMLHLTMHLVKEVRLCGPVYLRWMYPFERFMEVLKGYVRNRSRPEGCIVKCYIAEEAIEFCTEYLSNVDAIGIPISVNINQNVGAPIPGGQVVIVDSNLWLHAHHYVLENTTIVQPYIEEHMEWLKLKNPRQSKRQKWLHDEHMRTFTYWFRKKVSNWC
ncbi:hypothetical protein CK203_058233 [Vitis vinifera]|uniref:DUF4218 domain-containing protein n=1 Tax=Vitis vinifera TaxID=29760 RepID=A0A438H5I9_VITVI|nr:hypothetical protein CK203_058233 [Vitis vinifera]